VTNTCIFEQSAWISCNYCSMSSFLAFSWVGNFLFEFS